MNELIDAAKAVLEWRDKNESWFVDPEEISRLRAAVERAEKREAVGFMAWWDEHVGYGELHRLASDKKLWTAAQQAERERIRARVRLAAISSWSACELYIGPPFIQLQKFVERLLEDNDE